MTAVVNTHVKPLKSIPAAFYTERPSQQANPAHPHPLSSVHRVDILPFPDLWNIDPYSDFYNIGKQQPIFIEYFSLFAFPLLSQYSRGKKGMRNMDWAELLHCLWIMVEAMERHGISSKEEMDFIVVQKMASASWNIIRSTRSVPAIQSPESNTNPCISPLFGPPGGNSEGEPGNCYETRTLLLI